MTWLTWLPLKESRCCCFFFLYHRLQNNKWKHLNLHTLAHATMTNNSETSGTMPFPYRSKIMQQQQPCQGHTQTASAVTAKQLVTHIPQNHDSSAVRRGETRPSVCPFVCTATISKTEIKRAAVLVGTPVKSMASAKILKRILLFRNARHSGTNTCGIKLDG